MGSPVAELIEVEELGHRFRDGSWGLRNLNLKIAERDILLLAGRNGSGKTLLARHLIGLARPSTGRVLYRGTAVDRDPERARRGIGLVFQDSEAQIVGQTVIEDASFGPYNLGWSPELVRDRAGRALALVGLEDRHERRPDSLSGGERRRLAIAGILAMEPECVVLDEPFANLDLVAIRQVLDVIRRLAAAGRTLVIVTHELEKCLAHASRLVIMDGGSIAYDGAPEGPPPERFEDYGLVNPYRYGRRREELTWLT